MNCVQEVAAEYTNKHGNNYNSIKKDVIGKYKFAMAFENSATDDYVTEKLFGVFVAGAVPRMFISFLLFLIAFNTFNRL